MCFYALNLKYIHVVFPSPVVSLTHSRTDWDVRRSAELLLLKERAEAEHISVDLSSAAAALRETNSVNESGTPTRSKMQSYGFQPKSDGLQPTSVLLFLVIRMLLVVMPFVTGSDALCY